MKRAAIVALVLAAWPVAAAPPAPENEEVAAETLRAAAAQVQVAKIDFEVQADPKVAGNAMARRFFNWPEHERYSDVTSADWKAKWRLFADALVARAKWMEMDAASLGRCLEALHMGRNRETMLCPVKEEGPFDLDTPRSEAEAFEKRAEENYQLALRDRDRNPEKWYDDSLAIIPVAAYLARYDAGACWIIVCKWEVVFGDRPVQLGHTMVWAMDAKSASVVAYVSCD